MLGRSCEDLRENSHRRALESQWFTVRKVRMPTPDQMPTTEVPAPTDADGVGRALQAALEAIAAAGDLEELKTVRIAHSGDKSPLALANRASTGLAPQEEATAAKIVRKSRGQVKQPLQPPQAQLEQERHPRHPETAST